MECGGGYHSGSFPPAAGTDPGSRHSLRCSSVSQFNSKHDARHQCHQASMSGLHLEDARSDQHVVIAAFSSVLSGRFGRHEARLSRHAA